MNIAQAKVAVDLSELGFEQACGELQAKSPRDVMLYCSANSTCLANRIRDKYGCSLLLVPNAMLKSPFVWAVEYKDSLYWSDATY